MFSGRQKSVVLRFYFEVEPDTGLPKVELEDGHLLGLEVGSVLARNVLDAVTKSHDYGCDGYRVDNYRECKKALVRPWVLPPDIAEKWSMNATNYLQLKKPPASITLLRREIKLSPEIGKLIEGRSLRRVFTWRPRTGGYVVETQDKT
jgi:hypothetical protein